MFKKNVIVLIMFLSFYVTSWSQSNLSHEIGFSIGPASFQSDYGERFDFETNVGNAGFTVGLLHYINFSSNAERDYFFNEHFKIRSELSYSKTKFQHFGKWIEGGNITLGKEQLRAMRGSSKLINLGAQAEFHFNSLHNFENSIGTFDPYISLGAAYSFYDTEASSTLGELGNTSTTFPKYLTPSDGRPHGFSTESKGVVSIIGGVGTRYKLTKMGDLLVDMRFQHFTSDWVDGLNPNKKIYKENKANDWMVWFNIGYIHYLEF